MAAVGLTRALTRRVPFETKPVLLSIGEAAEVARGNNHGAKARRLSYVESNGGVSRRDERRSPPNGEDGDGSVEALIEVAQAALESPLLPLPVPSLSPSLPPEKEEHCTAVQGAAKNGPDGGKAMDKEGKKSTVPAPVMAGLILDTFMQTPGAVLRALRANLQRG